MPRRVRRHAGILTEYERGQSQDHLGQAHHPEGEPQTTHASTRGVDADRREDPRRQIGHWLRRTQAHATVQPRRLLGIGAAHRTRLQMGVERLPGGCVVLAVQTSRDLRTCVVTVHTPIVGCAIRFVPRYRPVAVDELTSLLLAARDGDRLALGAFVRSTQAEIWRMARHLVGSDDAEDVTQDVFVRAWRALSTYRAEASARTWLLAIARRACSDAIRERTRRRRLRARIQAQPARPSAVEHGEATALADLLAVLPTERREAFVLTQILGCSYDEAAAVAEVPVGTIRSRVARAREALVEAVRTAEAV